MPLDETARGLGGFLFRRLQTLRFFLASFRFIFFFLTAGARGAAPLRSSRAVRGHDLAGTRARSARSPTRPPTDRPPMKIRDVPPAEYAFGYRVPPRSGNEINGHGEREPRRATQVFHNADSSKPIDWQGLDDFFMCVNPWQVVRHRLLKQVRTAEGAGPGGPPGRG